MSWLYSQVLVEEYLVVNSLDGEQFAQLNGSHTQQAFLSPDRMTAFSRLSRFGMTFKPLTGNLGEDLLTWYLAASLAKTLVQPVKAQESKESDHPCGNTWRESSAKFDRNTHSWKTHRCLWEEDLAPSSLTLPKWGMMQSGVLWEHITSPLHTDETESGSLLPTPTCADATMGAILNDNTKLITLKSGKLRKISNQGVSGSIGLARTVAMWPTPKANEPGMTVKTTGRGVEKSTHLTTQVALAEGMIDRNTGRLWPTPQAHKITRSGEIVNADGTEWDGLSKPHSKTTGRPITTALADAVAMWPTPTASTDGPEPEGKTGRKLATMVKLYPTPGANEDSYRLAGNSQQSNGLGAMARREALEESPVSGGQLNPTWVEWLMGWPLGWTDLKPLEMDKFRLWLNSHGKH